MTKKRFTWLDGVVILVALLLIAGVAWYFSRGDQPIAASKTQEYRITMRFTRETTHPTDYYEVGDLLYQSNKTLIGTIESLEEKDLVTEEYNPASGEYLAVTDPARKQVEMKVRVTGSTVNGIFSVNGEELYIGKQFYPQSKTTRSTMVIWNIEEVA